MKPRRNFSMLGKWVSQTTRAEILVCACGRKYIHTRKGQIACIPCTYEAKIAADKK
ncbi:hypothetical protein KW797_04675 [Candidatus Parcubacteria bacterium]|nr:hypothetical protein [Candidatus Parcubacteria bacterium]